jgi:hypothetical protein
MRLPRSWHVVLAVLACSVCAAASAYNAHPKLDVVIVIDQFRGDYLERYRDQFGEGGFRLCLDHGIGMANVWMALSADHGVALLPEFAKTLCLPAANLDAKALGINAQVQATGSVLTEALQPPRGWRFATPSAPDAPPSFTNPPSSRPNIPPDGTTQ